MTIAIVTPTPALAAEADARFEGIADPVEQALAVLTWAGETFGDSFAITSSMADGLLAHLASRAVPGVNVVFLNTGYHFAETIGTRDWIAGVLPITLHDVQPPQTVAQQDAEHGPALYERDPDLCCALRKVQPFTAGLSSYDAWATGVRREQGGTRSRTPVVGYDEERRKVVVAPLARWTQADIDAYIAEHHLIVNPLHFDGYSSIGCWPCTRRATPGEDARSGRWPGSAKSECGIHS